MTITNPAFAAGYSEGFEHGWDAACAMLALPDQPEASTQWPEHGLVPDAWEHTPGEGVPADELPPDLTFGSVTDADVLLCGQVWRGWSCTRRDWHTGRHAAGVAGSIVAVWRTGFEIPAHVDQADDGALEVSSAPEPMEVCS